MSEKVSSLIHIAVKSLPIKKPLAAKRQVDGGKIRTSSRSINSVGTKVTLISSQAPIYGSSMENSWVDLQGLLTIHVIPMFANSLYPTTAGTQECTSSLSLPSTILKQGLSSHLITWVKMRANLRTIKITKTTAQPTQLQGAYVGLFDVEASSGYEDHS